MTNPQLYACKTCKKDHFRTMKGLNQHMERTKTCNPLFLEAAAKLAKVYEKAVDQRADELQLDYEESDGDFDAPLDLGYAQMPNRDEESLGQVVMCQDDDDWGIDSDDEQIGAVVPAEERYADQAIRQFKEHCRKVRDHMHEFDDDERAAVTLMDVIMRKKATLDTYAEVMEWHIDTTKDDGR